MGFGGGQSGAGVGFLRVLWFPLPIFIPPIAPKIILIYHRGLCNGLKWPQYQGLIDTLGLSTAPRIIIIIMINLRNMGIAYKIGIRKPEENKPLGRPKC
jgi:hypothetical protein